MRCNHNLVSATSSSFLPWLLFSYQRSLGLPCHQPTTIRSSFTAYPETGAARSDDQRTCIEITEPPTSVRLSFGWSAELSWGAWCGWYNQPVDELNDGAASLIPKSSPSTSILLLHCYSSSWWYHCEFHYSTYSTYHVRLDDHHRPSIHLVLILYHHIIQRQLLLLVCGRDR